MDSKLVIKELHKKWTEIGSPIRASELELELEIYKKLLDIVQVGRSYYFIFNPRTRSIEYVSKEVVDILGIPAQSFTITYMLEHIHPDDLSLMADFETEVVAFKTRLPPEKLMKYKTRYNYRLRTNNGNYLHILQQSITVQTDEEGKVVRNLIFHTDITEISDFKKMKLAFIGLENEPSIENVQPQMQFSKSKEIFTKSELGILKLVVQGMNSHAISENINRSIHTVRNHRKNILQKSGCSNLQELLIKSIREGWV